MQPNGQFVAPYFVREDFICKSARLWNNGPLNLTHFYWEKPDSNRINLFLGGNTGGYSKRWLLSSDTRLQHFLTTSGKTRERTDNPPGEFHFHLQPGDDLKQRHVLVEAGNRGETMALSRCHAWQTAGGYCTSGVHMQQLYCGDTVRTISRGDGVARRWLGVFTFSCQRSWVVAGCVGAGLL